MFLRRGRGRVFSLPSIFFYLSTSSLSTLTSYFQKSRAKARGFCLRYCGAAGVGYFLSLRFSSIFHFFTFHSYFLLSKIPRKSAGFLSSLLRRGRGRVLSLPSFFSIFHFFTFHSYFLLQKSRAKARDFCRLQIFPSIKSIFKGASCGRPFKNGRSVHNASEFYDKIRCDTHSDARPIRVFDLSETTNKNENLEVSDHERT